MELRQLVIFLTISECGTFSEAAKRLFLSQPTLSVQTAALEKELGVKLFERQGKHLALTSAGQILRRYATDMLGLRDRALEELAKYKKAMSGTVKLSSSTVPADYILPRLISQFLKQHPEVYIELLRSDSDAVWEKVLAYEVDFGIVGTCRNQPSVECTPLQDDEIVIIAPASGKYIKWPPVIDLPLLINQPLILRELGSGTQKTFDDALTKQGLSPQALTIRTRLESMEAVKTAILSGLGLGITSRLAVKNELQNGTLLAFSVDSLDLRRKFYLIKQKQKVLSPVTEAFVRFILDSCKGD
ncbi:MAG: selenium metabolism-associated LysR family transcriptional regulator [bacterium]